MEQRSAEFAQDGICIIDFARERSVWLGGRRRESRLWSTEMNTGLKDQTPSSSRFCNITPRHSGLR